MVASLDLSNRMVGVIMIYCGYLTLTHAPTLGMRPHCHHVFRIILAKDMGEDVV